MHPLLDNLTLLSFEDLEKRRTQLLNKMHLMQKSGISSPEAWVQLELLLHTIDQERMERAWTLNQPNKHHSEQHIVVSTDPLESDDPVQASMENSKKFRPIT